MMIDIIRNCQQKSPLPHDSSLKVWRFYDVSKLKLKSIDKDMNIRALPAKLDSTSIESLDNTNVLKNTVNSNDNSENNNYTSTYNLSSLNNTSSNSILQSINENLSNLYTLQKEMDDENASYITDKKDLSQFFPERQSYDNTTEYVF